MVGPWKYAFYVQEHILYHLIGSSKELCVQAKSGVVRLPNMDPYDFTWLLRYFYSALTDSDVHPHPFNLRNMQIVRLYVIATEYNINNIRSLLLKQYDLAVTAETFLADLLQFYQGTGSDEEVRSFFKNNIMDLLPTTLRYAQHWGQSSVTIPQLLDTVEASPLMVLDLVEVLLKHFASQLVDHEQKTKSEEHANHYTWGDAQAERLKEHDADEEAADCWGERVVPKGSTSRDMLGAESQEVDASKERFFDLGERGYYDGDDTCSCSGETDLDKDENKFDLGSTTAHEAIREAESDQATPRGDDNSNWGDDSSNWGNDNTADIEVGARDQPIKDHGDRSDFWDFQQRNENTNLAGDGYDVFTANLPCTSESPSFFGPTVPPPTILASDFQLGDHPARLEATRFYYPPMTHQVSSTSNMYGVQIDNKVSPLAQGGFFYIATALFDSDQDCTLRFSKGDEICNVVSLYACFNHPVS